MVLNKYVEASCPMPLLSPTLSPLHSSLSGSLSVLEPAELLPAVGSQPVILLTWNTQATPTPR